MLNIKTVKNVLITDEKKDSFCFRSFCSQTLSQKELAKEMTDWNSSFTEADYLGMLSVMGSIVTKFLAKGYNIELPFGSVRVSVSGTCANIQDSFNPATSGHNLGFIFNINDETASLVKTRLEYSQLPPDSTGEPKLYRLNTLNPDASESTELSVTSGKSLRLHGRNLRFDITDEKQGVFFENEKGPVRVTTFNRRGTNVIDLLLPKGLEAGSYSTYIVTRPGSNYFTASIDSVVTIA